MGRFFRYLWLVYDATPRQFAILGLPSPWGCSLTTLTEQSEVADDTAHHATAPLVHVITMNGLISPISAEFILISIQDAEQENAQCLIIQLDAPGGLIVHARPTCP